MHFFGRINCSQRIGDSASYGICNGKSRRWIPSSYPHFHNSIRKMLLLKYWQQPRAGSFVTSLIIAACFYKFRICLISWHSWSQKVLPKYINHESKRIFIINLIAASIYNSRQLIITWILLKYVSVFAKLIWVFISLEVVYLKRFAIYDPHFFTWLPDCPYIQSNYFLKRKSTGFYSIAISPVYLPIEMAQRIFRRYIFFPSACFFLFLYKHH